MDSTDIEKMITVNAFENINPGNMHLPLSDISKSLKLVIKLPIKMLL